jgi:hypothetical protein
MVPPPLSPIQAVSFEALQAEAPAKATVEEGKGSDRLALRA